MKVIEATVKFAAGKQFESKQTSGGKRQNIKLVIANGEEIDIWFNAGERKYCRLAKGDRVRLVQNGEKFSLVDSEPDEQPPTPRATPAALASDTEKQTSKTVKGLASMDKDTRAAIFRELCSRSQFLKSCHVQIVSSFTNVETGECVIDEETIQKYVLTLYIDMKNNW